jgi:hypothetical protein
LPCFSLAPETAMLTPPSAIDLSGDRSPASTRTTLAAQN